MYFINSALYALHSSLSATLFLYPLLAVEAPLGSAEKGRVMMGRQTVDQSKLFYLFNLEGEKPADLPVQAPTKFKRQ